MTSATHDSDHGEPTTRIRAAFYGRVAHDRDRHPLTSVEQQAVAARKVLESLAPIVSCYIDTAHCVVESSRQDRGQAQHGGDGGPIAKRKDDKPPARHGDSRAAHTYDPCEI